ncbi:lytic transglycosylase domain-containing protein [Synechococcus sp. CS-1328]|nr:lytic transglycosylase domain-containing protein [Synechococcus sp. CS-1328]
MPAPGPHAVPRFPLLIAATTLGTGAALLGGGALLQWLRPPLTPAVSSAALTRAARWDPDPWRRRDAALLLHARLGEEPRQRRQLLRHQGWGADPLAAVVLKQDALAAEALGDSTAATQLWQQQLRRFPDAPSSADALYALGREQPIQRQRLRQRFPAHPAALAAALEAGDQGQALLDGASHLARWGARWPGAMQPIRAACALKDPAPNAGQRDQLAAGLAQLGDGQAALACLRGGRGSNATELSLAQALLKGTAADNALGQGRLLELVRRAPEVPEADEAVRLLVLQPQADALLAQLPPRWRSSAPVQAHAALAGGGRGALAVLQRWPTDRASWDLQWELARSALLAGRWADASQLLSTITPETLPAPLAARASFWLAYAQVRQGNRQAGLSRWQELRRQWPGGYYAWRAAVQLGDPAADTLLEEQAIAPANPDEPAASGEPWWPLQSGDPGLDTLWRLDQRLEAWEQWRQRRGNVPPGDSATLLVEGRLRQGVGDDWTGLGQLELASLRLAPDPCGLQPLLERSLHPQRFLPEFQKAAAPVGLPVSLLLAVAKQESRFTPTVHSPADAVGLLQLLPSTASELAGRPTSSRELEDPGLNARLGALYLHQLARQWDQQLLPIVASYNAGPGAVTGWLAEPAARRRLRDEPELWVEAIPYPETRLYVKKVLGNLWSYSQAPVPITPAPTSPNRGCPASVLP